MPFETNPFSDVFGQESLQELKDSELQSRKQLLEEMQQAAAETAAIAVHASAEVVTKEV